MANSKPKDGKDGTVPLQLLNQLNEHTAGGFVLFYFNSESGMPEQALTFDSPAHSLALQKHIEDWSTALHDLCIESEKSHFSVQCKDDEDDVI
jgi:hypothetical protein